MEAINITVKIPALGNTYEFLVPSNMPVSEVQFLMIKILNAEYGVSENVNDLLLFDTSDNKFLKLDCTFSQLGIISGANLMLI